MGTPSKSGRRAGSGKAAGAKAEPAKAVVQESATPPVPVETGNVISFGDPQGGGTQAGKRAEAGEKKSARARKAKGGDSPVQVAPREERREALPDSVQERFIRVGHQFYFPDGAEAFADHGRRLTTRSENAVVIQAMVEIAQARGARDVQVSGSEFFRKEAWFAARLAGLDVRGYEPTTLEQERVVRAIGRRDAARTAPETDANSVTAAERPAAGGRPPPRERVAPDTELLVGRLVEHGPAPYQHRPGQPRSYYVRLETDRGEVERWGVDLERAFRESLSNPGIGAEVGLRKLGSDPVTIRTMKRDAGGREVGQEERPAKRNQWSVEKTDFLEQRSRMAAVFRDPEVNAADAVRKHPELDGSYVQLQMGRALAQERFASKAHQEQFVEHLRAFLAREIEQGRPLQPVPLRERHERTAQPERVADREYTPVR